MHNKSSLFFRIYRELRKKSKKRSLWTGASLDFGCWRFLRLPGNVTALYLVRFFAVSTGIDSSRYAVGNCLVRTRSLLTITICLRSRTIFIWWSQMNYDKSTNVSEKLGTCIANYTHTSKWSGRSWFEFGACAWQDYPGSNLQFSELLTIYSVS